MPLASRNAARPSPAVRSRVPDSIVPALATGVQRPSPRFCSTVPTTRASDATTCGSDCSSGRASQTPNAATATLAAAAQPVNLRTFCWRCRAATVARHSVATAARTSAMSLAEAVGRAPTARSSAVMSRRRVVR